jgi:thioredoxin-like negative regulator of GroEL
MGEPFMQRLLIILALVASGLLVYRLAGLLTLRRAGALSSALLEGAQGKPVLLYFTTPACAPCKTVQRPAIRRLEELTAGRLEVVEIDASARPDLADRWGVLSVPTTFVLDASGRPRHVNHGVTSTTRLLAQFQDVLPSSLPLQPNDGEAGGNR